MPSLLTRSTRPGLILLTAGLLGIAACLPVIPTPTPASALPPQNPPLPPRLIISAATPPAGDVPGTPAAPGGYPAPPTAPSTTPRPVPTQPAYP